MPLVIFPLIEKPMSEIDNRKQVLAKELEHEISHAESNARCNHLTSMALMFSALSSSIAAAVMGVLFGVPTKTVGAVASLPALIAFASSQLKLDAKSGWHYRKATELKALRSRLLFQQPESPSVDNISAIARERDALQKRMQLEWDRTLGFNWGGFPNHRRSCD